jgi:hypothetical protein
VVVPEFKHVADYDGFGFFCERLLATVVGECWANVISVLSAVIPGALHCCFVVYVHSASSGPERRCIEVEWSKEGFPCQVRANYVAPVEKIEC